MEWVRRGVTVIWKTGYPLMVYYLAVFSCGEILAALGIPAGDGVEVIALGAVLAAAILWFPYKRDWLFRQGIVKKPRFQLPPLWQHLVILGIAASLAGNVVIGLTPLAQWFPGVGEAVERVESSVSWVQFFGVCLVIPVAEEMVFRGIGYGGLRDELGAIPAAAVSAAFFGVFHGNLVQGIYAACLGLILGFLMERYHTLSAVWLAHAAMNIGSIYILNGVLSGMLGESVPAWAAVGSLALAVTAAELRLIGRKMEKRPWKLI